MPADTLPFFPPPPPPPPMDPQNGSSGPAGTHGVAKRYAPAPRLEPGPAAKQLQSYRPNAPVAGTPAAGGVPAGAVAMPPSVMPGAPVPAQIPLAPVAGNFFPPPPPPPPAPAPAAQGQAQQQPARPGVITTARRIAAGPQTPQLRAAPAAVPQQPEKKSKRSRRKAQGHPVHGAGPMASKTARSDLHSISVAKLSDVQLQKLVQQPLGKNKSKGPRLRSPAPAPLEPVAPAQIAARVHFADLDVIKADADALRRQDSTTTTLLFVGWSIVLHVVALSFVAVAIPLAAMLGWIVPVPRQNDPELLRTSAPSALQFRPPPQQQMQKDLFLPSSAKGQVEDNPEAAAQSDRSQKARTREQARDKSSPMPEMKGKDKHALNYEDAQGSGAEENAPSSPSRTKPQKAQQAQQEQQAQKATPAQQQQQQQNQKPQEQPKDQQKQQQPQQPQDQQPAPPDPKPEEKPEDMKLPPSAQPLDKPEAERRPEDKEVRAAQPVVDTTNTEQFTPSKDPRALPVLPAVRVPPPVPTRRHTTVVPMDMPSPQANPQQPRRQQQAQQAVPKTPPPSFNFNKRRSDVSGGGMEGEFAPDVRETDIGKYKAKLYRTVGYRWRLAVAARESVVTLGQVRIRFYVRANGVMENVKVVERSQNSALLEAASLEAMLKSMPFEPFSEGMRQQVGEGFEDEFTFTIY
ncbi:MAG TPA: energy transducer TonB [Candidatus Methylacidiphilales bacterium]|nr:energy transducer TonB [Candidatus Methylacidiphilales bacterium]